MGMSQNNLRVVTKKLLAKAETNWIYRRTDGDGINPWYIAELWSKSVTPINDNDFLFLPSFLPLSGIPEPTGIPVVTLLFPYPMASNPTKSVQF